MQFHKTDDATDKGLICRSLSSEGLVEVGIFRVMFGFRVRAGFTAGGVTPYDDCRIDWCGGDNWSAIQMLRRACIEILSQREEDRHCFDDIPSITDVKPYFYDRDFLQYVVTALPGGDLKHSFAVLWSLRKDEILIGPHEHWKFERKTDEVS